MTQSSRKLDALDRLLHFERAQLPIFLELYLETQNVTN